MQKKSQQKPPTLPPAFKFRIYSLKELADLYKCSPRTLSRKLKCLKKPNESRKPIFYPKELFLVVEILGAPYGSN